MDPQALGADHRLWLLATVPLSLLGLCGLAFAIWKLVSFFTGGGLPRLKEVVPALPIVAQQTVAFPEAGEVVLTLEARLASTVFMGVAFNLVDPQSGKSVPGRMKLFRVTRTGLDGRTRLQYRTYPIPAPGEYVLRMTGLKGGRDYSSAAVLFTRDMRFVGELLPAVGGAFLRIAAAILMAGLAIGMAVLSALIWLGEFPGSGHPARPDAYQGEPRK